MKKLRKKGSASSMKDKLSNFKAYEIVFIIIIISGHFFLLKCQLVNN